MAVCYIYGKIGLNHIGSWTEFSARRFTKVTLLSTERTSRHSKTYGSRRSRSAFHAERSPNLGLIYSFKLDAGPLIQVLHFHLYCWVIDLGLPNHPPSWNGYPRHRFCSFWACISSPTSPRLRRCALAELLPALPSRRWQTFNRRDVQRYNDSRWTNSCGRNKWLELV